MNYYNNPDLGRQYGVSRRTVTNWIEQARLGRLDLELIKDGANYYISKHPRNQLKMRTLVQERRKFLNKRSLKVARPKPEFYEIFNGAQIVDIIHNLDKYRELSLQYNYFDDGAALWDRYARGLYDDETVPNMMTQTVSMLDTSESYIDKVVAKHDRVNVVDIGPGNALPVRNLLAHLAETGKLGRYIAIDISEEMLAIAERNIREWFDGHVAFEGHVRDISREWFADVIAELPTGDAGSAANLVLLLGATLVNFRAPQDVLRNVVGSMGYRDYLIYTTGIDSALGRQQFHFSINENESRPLPPPHSLMVDLLGIEASDYTTEAGFNEQERARYFRIRLKHALTLEFKLPKGSGSLDLNKGETLLVWRARHSTASEISDQFQASGLNPLLVSQAEGHDYMLIMADLRNEGR